MRPGSFWYDLRGVLLGGPITMRLRLWWAFRWAFRRYDALTEPDAVMARGAHDWQDEADRRRIALERAQTALGVAARILRETIPCVGDQHAEANLRQALRALEVGLEAPVPMLPSTHGL